MLCIDSKNFDPFFNLATEEYLLKSRNEDIFMLWVSSPAVIVGKHQNTLGEINYPFVKKEGIAVARRLSGGGAVYHDKGNLNFTWVLNGEKGKLVDFKKFINPVISYLNGLGIKAYFGGRNDIHVNNKKISGNAEHVYKNRTLHHGTLLFNTDLDKLRASLKLETGKYVDKAVKSMPHPVTNLNSEAPGQVGFEDFRMGLLDYIFKNFDGCSMYNLENPEIKQIKRLCNEKFTTWEWIYGYSPKYKFTKWLHINGKDCCVGFEVEKGRISKSTVKHLNDPFLRDVITEALNNCMHKEDALIHCFNMSREELAYCNVDPVLLANDLF
jgi:lipoate---protein ligase